MARQSDGQIVNFASKSLILLVVCRYKACYDCEKCYELENSMASVAVSPKFQVVIPKEIRRALRLVAGQRLEARLVDGKVELTPEVTIAQMRGRWPGIDATIVRETDRV